MSSLTFSIEFQIAYSMLLLKLGIVNYLFIYLIKSFKYNSYFPGKAKLLLKKSQIQE